MLQRFHGDLVLLYEGPVYAVYLGSRVDNCGGVDVFHSESGYNEFHFNVQGILSLEGTMDCGGEFLCQSGSPF